MTHNEIEQYLNDKELNTFEYQLAMDAMLFAEQKTIERAREWIKNSLYDTQDNCGYKVVASFDSVDVNEFINDFKRAMEG
jgi:hypothetical protein